MALEKITETQMNEQGVCAAPDILNGSPTENKAIFDRMVRSLVAPAYNQCVDAVNELAGMEEGIKTSEEERTAAEEQRAEEEEKRNAAEAERQAAEEARQDLESGYVARAESGALTAESWAVGGTGTRAGEDTDNAKYYAEQAKKAAGGGTGDMSAATYDPQGKAQDIFAYAIPAADKGNAGGVAELGEDGKVPAGQLPEISSSEAKQITLTVEGWSEGSDGRYAQTVAVDGVTAEPSQIIVVDVDLTTDDADARVTYLEAWAGPSANEADQGDGTLTFYSYDRPTVNIPVAVGVA